ncbi:MAG: class I SAM-dependent methyltransferase [Anaerolineales bacterium]
MSDKTAQHNYDRLSRWYNLFAASEKHFTKAGLDMLNVRSGEHILEIGPGTGHALAALAHQTRPTGLLAGVDISAGMLGVARKRMQAEGVERCAALIQGDALHIPFVCGSFDAVFLSFTLELFADIPAVLAECQRVLKPDGRMGMVCMAKDESLACRLYQCGHARWPSVLDCRPIHAEQWLSKAGFFVTAAHRQHMWGLPVDILVAEKTVSGQGA